MAHKAMRDIEEQKERALSEMNSQRMVTSNLNDNREELHMHIA